MNEIKCPNCKTVFQINEQDYDSIVKQIRDSEFEKEIKIRERQFQDDKEKTLKIQEAELKAANTEEINKKNIEITELNFSASTVSRLYVIKSKYLSSNKHLYLYSIALGVIISPVATSICRFALSLFK